MTSSSWGYWGRVGLTLILSLSGVSALLGYLYLSFRRFYRKRENRWWVSLLAIGLPFIALTSGLLIWMLWNPLVSSLFWVFLFLSFLISVILCQSVTSPYKMADWWIEFDKWRQKRKSQ